ALAIGERKLDALRVGGIDHDRGFDLADQLVVERRDILDLIAVRALQADIDNMRAAFHLPARNLGGLFPLFGADEILKCTRSDYVRALTDDQRPRALFGFDNVDAGIHRAMIRFGRASRSLAFRHLRDCANMLFRGPTASAHNVEPAPLDESAELVRKRCRRLPVPAFLVWQARIRIARDESR